METLATKCIKSLKNPCDGSFNKTLGNIYPYCYLLQQAFKMSDEINNDQCTCGILKTCKSKNGSCVKITNKKMHVFNCSRTLCKNCSLFRRYDFICYKMIFMNKPMPFQLYITELLKLIQLKNIIIKADYVVQTKHCYHSNDYQDF